jgi:hypothetical protein
LFGVSRSSYIVITYGLVYPCVIPLFFQITAIWWWTIAVVNVKCFSL